MGNDNENNFIATLHNILLAPDLCNRLYNMIQLMNLGEKKLFHKEFFTVYFVDKERK